MSIQWRPATWSDMEPGLGIQPNARGDGAVGALAALTAWKQIFHSFSFFSAAIEAFPAIKGFRLIGLGAAALVSGEFIDRELAHPRPDITSRVVEHVLNGPPVLATREEIARANAGAGVDVMILYSAWRDDILTPAERRGVQAILPSSFADNIAGYRIRRILIETTAEEITDFNRRSPEWQIFARFPELGRVIFLMTVESATALPGSLGNLIFKFEDPVLRLPDSDQQLLLSALRGGTDEDLAVHLGITLAAVKARWRSTFDRIADVMPSLLFELDDHAGRGAQKRHRVLAYVRSHPEELRPFDWKAARSRGAGAAASKLPLDSDKI